MPLSVEDKSEILELCARYNYAADGNDPDAWVDTFTEDGVFVTHKGTEELSAFLLGLIEGKKRRGRVGRHWNTNHVIEGDGDTARHRCYLLTFRTNEDGPPSIGFMGTYDDRLKKVNGKWKFANRQLARDESTEPQAE